MQSMLQASFSIVDQIMIGQLGETNISAVGLCGNFSLIFSVVIGAVSTVAGILIAQFIGADDLKEAWCGFDVSLICGLLIAAVFLFVSGLFPAQILRLYTKQVERVSKEAVEELDSKEVILIPPSQRKNNKTVRVLKTPETDTSERKVYIPKFVAQCLIDIKKEQDEVKEALGSEYTDYNLIKATTFGMPINDSYIRDQMQKVIDKEGLPDVVFHSRRHTSVTYKLKLSGGDIKAVQGDSGHAQADMVTEVYGHIIDEDRRKNAERLENAFYNKENLNPQMKGADADQAANMMAVPEGVDAELLMKVLGNPEMAALLTSLAKSLN